MRAIPWKRTRPIVQEETPGPVREAREDRKVVRALAASVEGLALVLVAIAMAVMSMSVVKASAHKSEVTCEAPPSR